MRKRILTLSLSLLFLGGMTLTSYAQVSNSTVKTELNDDDDKKKKSSSKKDKDCSSKKSCCKSELDAKCKDKDASKDKKDEGKQK
jgi:hypothetical protein